MPKNIAFASLELAFSSDIRYISEMSLEMPHLPTLQMFVGGALLNLPPPTFTGTYIYIALLIMPTCISNRDMCHHKINII